MTVLRNVAGVGVIGLAMFANDSKLQAADSCENMRDMCAPDFFYYGQCEIREGQTWSLYGCGEESPVWCIWNQTVACS